MAVIKRPTFTRCGIPGQAAGFALGVWMGAATMARFDRLLHPNGYKQRPYFPRPEYQDQLVFFAPMSLFAALLFMGWLWRRCRKRSAPDYAWPAPLAVGLVTPLLSQALARMAETMPANFRILSFPLGLLAFLLPLLCAEFFLQMSAPALPADEKPQPRGDDTTQPY